MNSLENSCNKMYVIKAGNYECELYNKFRLQKSEIAQWKNNIRKIDEESLQVHGLVKKATENLWIKLVNLKN